MQQLVEAFSSAPIRLAALISARRTLVVRLVVVASLVVYAVEGQHGDELEEAHRMRHQAHYLNPAPAVHFQYAEGRQARRHQQPVEERAQQVLAGEQQHMYRRSSAVETVAGLAGAASVAARYPPLVSSSLQLRRRMLAPAPEVAGGGPQDYYQLVQPQAVEQQQQASLAGSPKGRSSTGNEDALKQHIQYHNEGPAQGPSSRCHKRTLNFCASVLPFNSTAFPNIIGDTDRFEVKRSLPFFGFLAKSSCNRRLDQLLCLLLEPPCAPHSGAPIPPCKKFCRLALEGCNEYIPATLAMSSVFDCRQYPDSSDPSVCVNLAQGSRCAPDEFKCPDKTCIPRNWLCDSVRDCVFAADEANCADSTGVGGQQSSVCSTEEFKCDAKCVPKAWRCDGERDCLDGSDEEACDLRPRCAADRFRCADDNGCIPKRWVCDGKAECRDGSDERHCEEQVCSESDFKCNNGICIPKLWRCDHQWDCRDGSDELACNHTQPIVLAEKLLNSSFIAHPASSSPVASSSEATTVAPPQEVSSSTEAPPATSSTGASSGEEQMVSNQVILEQPAAAQAFYMSLQEAGQPVVAPHTELQHQQQQQQRSLQKFDYQLIKTAATPTGAPPASQQAAAGSNHQQRVPIYRSLFKSFKSGASRVVGGAKQPASGQTAATGRRRLAIYRSASSSPAPDELTRLLQVSQPAQARADSAPAQQVSPRAPLSSYFHLFGGSGPAAAAAGNPHRLPAAAHH